MNQSSFLHKTQHCEMSSPLGKIVLAAQNNLIHGIWFEGQKHFPNIDNSWEKANRNNFVFDTAINQLQLYFKGKLKEFTFDTMANGTDFQKRVWKELNSIPYGESKSYLDIATQLGNKNAARAVGSAIGRNPISIAVPCHRVVGSSGSLTGYAGGLEHKKFLLQLESKELKSHRFCEPL
jgi:methylated-DNA-[protein]-cysteine S-methyltransferase